MDDVGREAAANGVAEIDVWLRGGGTVVAASERAARALASAFHRARRREGLTAWPAPAIRDWHSFILDAWRELSGDDRLLLSGIQEQALWVEIVRARGQGSGLLDGPRQRVAAMAMDAYALLCAYAPRYLQEKLRSAWQQDAAVFSGWLSEFDRACRSLHALSAARAPLELQGALQAQPHERPSLLLAGFDRLLPVQRDVFQAWGQWSEARPGAASASVRFYEAPDPQTELEACARWCGDKLAANAGARLLVVVQGIAERRGAIERALLRQGCGGESEPRFEFSLGAPLSGIALPRGAHTVLRWLSGPLEEREIDWLFSTGQCASGEAEQYALTGFMRALRRGDRQRTRWDLDSFLAQRCGVELPGAWVGRTIEAKRKLEESARRAQSPPAWAELLPGLLTAAGWPYPEGSRRVLTSEEFQALRRWHQVVDACASLGFDGRRMTWSEFLAGLGNAVNDTLFAPESRDKPIQIAGPAESAGLTADAIWFLGASDDAWPAGGLTHPFLPIEMQREAAMPHASAQLDWDVARAVTARLLASAAEAHVSYARQSEGAAMRHSRLMESFAGTPEELPAAWRSFPAPEPITVGFRDTSRIPLRGADAAGGSTVLTSQSLCPFKAFATARLGAQGWDHAQAGLTAAQRGQLLHAVLHSVWGGPPAGIRTRAELAALADLPAFVREHAQRAMAGKVPAAAREQMPRRYLEIETMRLVRLVSEWLAFERERVEFSVARTELDVSRNISGLMLQLRLDRIDRLKNGSLLVIDYKTGVAGPKLWDMPRPEDVQLPLYAAAGLDPQLRAQIAQEFGAEQESAAVAGLLFAKVRAGEACFAGRIREPGTMLLRDLDHNSALVKKKFTDEELLAWSNYIQQMAQDYLEGHAEVNPRDYPKTCERCGLLAVCRVRQNRADGECEFEEGGDE